MKKNLRLTTIVLSAFFAFMFSLNLRAQCPPTTFTVGPTAPLTWTAMPTYPPGVTQAYWYWGDGNMSTGLYPSHTYTAAGMYTICVVGVNTVMTCSLATCNTYSISKTAAMIQISVVNGSPTSITENSAAGSIAVFPNPSTGKLKISGQQENGVLTVYNILGAKVQEVKLERNVSYDLDLSPYENGIYQVEFNNGKSAIRQKVILSK